MSKYIKNILVVMCLSALFQPLVAQKGTIRGAVTDGSTGEVIMFGAVLVKEISDGTTTDLDGKFSIDLSPGIYTLEFSYLGFSTHIEREVNIKPGLVTLLDIVLQEDSKVLDEVVVTATIRRNSATALAALKRNSTNVMDGITASSFRTIGDSDAASAIKRVTGVSVDDGKYVYVRGLGDRYTKSMLNGMDIPGLDPDRNTLQLDIFPTTILDNILVLKTFTAELPADFTGGVVDITTKDFPEEKSLSISAGLGYNPSMHFNNKYLTYNGGSTDFLGFDDGGRAIPTEGYTNIPFRANATADPNGAGKIFSEILGRFNPDLGAYQAMSKMDYNLGIAAGNQWSKSKKSYGYNFGLTYQNKTEYYEDVFFNRYGLSGNPDITEMNAREVQHGAYGTNNVLLGGIAGFSMKTLYTKFSINLLHLQNGESKAGVFNFYNTDQGSNFEALQHNLEYSQRSITNVLLKGSVVSKDAKWHTSWSVAPTLSKITDPDIRYTRFRTDGGGFTISTESGIPERIWRYLTEKSYTGNIGTTMDYSLMSRPAKLRFGSAYVYKDRDYNILNFQIFTNATNLTGDPDQIFLPENLWSSENRNGVTYDPQFLPNNPNKYRSNTSNAAGYISNEAQFTSRLKAVVGLRAEYYVQRYTGLNQNRDVYNQRKVLDDLDFFPTANLIYALSTKQNLRLSFARTIARPSFKEASFATIFDPITGRTFIGGLFPDIDVTTGEQIWSGQLRKTDINNIDLRWELFQDNGQYFSLSGFYKTFKDPIEIVQYVQASNNFQPRNVGNGMVLGAEFEISKNLGFLTGALEDLTFSTNLAWVKSTIEMSPTEYTSRINNARTGEKVSDKREMAGQAPYLVNTGLVYKNPFNKLEIGAFYNVQGRTLQFVGIADRPDVYSVPFHSLNFNANYPFSKDDRFTVGIRISNLLNDDKEQVYQSFNTGDQYFSRLSPGNSFSLRLGYTFK